MGIRVGDCPNFFSRLLAGGRLGLGCGLLHFPNNGT